MQDNISTVPLRGDREGVAIATCGVVVVGNVRWIHRVGVGNIGVDRHTKALNLPVARHLDCCPLAVVILLSPEAFGALCGGLGPVEAPLTANIHHQLRVSTLCGSLGCEVGCECRLCRELVLGKHLGILPIGVGLVCQGTIAYG